MANLPTNPARNRNYSPSLGVWISQDPAQYINGADRYQFVEGGPVGRTDPTGLLTYSYESDYFVNQVQAGMVMGLANGMDDFRYNIHFDVHNVGGEPSVGTVFANFRIGTRTIAPNGTLSIKFFDLNAGYFLKYGTQTIPLPPGPDGAHSLLLGVRLIFYHSYNDNSDISIPIGPLGFPHKIPSGPGVTYLGAVDDYFIITVDCQGKISVEALGPGP